MFHDAVGADLRSVTPADVVMAGCSAAWYRFWSDNTCVGCVTVLLHPGDRPALVMPVSNRDHAAAIHGA